MRISHGSRLANYSKMNGYGYATDRMVASLRELGHSIEPNDLDAPVQLWFDQPQHMVWNHDQYKIAYHPWESSVLRDGWVDILNQADEVWTPSQLVANWYRRQGIERPVFVYAHGVDPVWSPRPRKVEDRIRFLHVGGDALRKGMPETMEAFRLAFQGRDDVSITFKMNSPELKGLPNTSRINFIYEAMPLDELVRLYHEHHAFVYPSWGEGFGLNPLQAISTGMPTICTAAWAPYRSYLPWRWRLNSTLVDSPWPKAHPGKMFKPNVDALVESMRHIADNYESHATMAMNVSRVVRRDYDWVSLTKEAFECLEKRLEKMHKLT